MEYCIINVIEICWNIKCFWLTFNTFTLLLGILNITLNYFIQLTRKNLMVKNLKRLRKQTEREMGKKEAENFDFYPTTYELPVSESAYINNFFTSLIWCFFFRCLNFEGMSIVWGVNVDSVVYISEEHNHFVCLIWEIASLWKLSFHRKIVVFFF